MFSEWKYVKHGTNIKQIRLYNNKAKQNFQKIVVRSYNLLRLCLNDSETILQIQQE